MSGRPSFRSDVPPAFAVLNRHAAEDAVVVVLCSEMKRQWEKENNSMSVKLTTHEKGDVIIVDVSGRLTLGESTSALRNRMRELVEGGSRRIVLNMADVTYIDSSGIGELVAAYTTIATAGGELKLLNLATRVHELLYIT